MNSINDNDLDKVSGGRGGGREREAEFKPGINLKYKCPACGKQDMKRRAEDVKNLYLHCNVCGCDFTVPKEIGV